ncbi:transglutaminase domain-containing protein [Marinomonas sp. RSW2]|uniref:Transglutaminase domain-containing protein n=1 Tax=Marinomonas maritima TaxID=2940935 RepID=A0ABT5WFM7_9GAMM|nr:transglutaminase domain-containing protein [Marinomonas maritima]MDE8603627.1 transglutaminase domain-containing protein [Marinomonas maritima]
MDYYRSVSEFTDPANYRELLRTCPNQIEEICTFTQNFLIHAYWLNNYHYSVSDSVKHQEMQLRSISAILDAAASKNKNILEQSRAPFERVISTCRDFSLMVCSILRAKDIPARLRCGFATYLSTDHFEDHWVCEYWNKETSMWIKVDAQLDNIHLENLEIDFDTCNVPDKKFIFAGEAWELCRKGKENPAYFGIQGLTGLSFIKANIVRDLFALRKIEMLPWDMGWGILNGPLVPITDTAEMSILDNLAIISKKSNENQAVEALKTKQLKLPNDWDWFQSPTIEQLMNT